MAIKTVQVYEYLRVNFADNQSDSNLDKGDLESLKSIEDTLPNNMYEPQGTDGLRFKQYVGNIFLPNGTVIEILPKVNQNTDKNDICRTSLLYMLTNVFNLNITSATSGMSSLEDMPLQDLIVRHFCFKLEEELHRGIIRIYVTEEDNLNALRGRLKFTEHIRHNFANKARFYCEFDEFSENNVYNQQLKAMLKVFESRVCSGDVKQQLINLEFTLAEVTDVSINMEQLSRLTFNRLNDRFEEIFTLGKIILQGYTPNMSTGEKLAPAMLFDMNKLFEEFVANKLRESLNVNSKKVFDVSTHESKQLGHNCFTLKPDIVVKYAGKIIGVLDTKWKSLSSPKPSISDVHQMYAYAQRFGCKYNVLLYPLSNSIKPQKIDSLYLRDTEDTENSVELHLNFFNLDFDKNYEKCKFKTQVEELAKELQKLS